MTVPTGLTQSVRFLMMERITNWERMYNEVAVTQFKTAFRHLLGETEDAHKKYQPGEQV
jgi:hypothetical protein